MIRHLFVSSYIRFIGARGDVYNDIAILKLTEPSTVEPIKLNNDTNYPSERLTPLTVIGFGATSEGGRVSSVLKELDTFFETIDNCQINYPDVEEGTHVCGDVDFQGDCQGMYITCSVTS
jgi:secreted trypsin-like serine protease